MQNRNSRSLSLITVFFIFMLACNLSVPANKPTPAANQPAHSEQSASASPTLLLPPGDTPTPVATHTPAATSTLVGGFPGTFISFFSQMKQAPAFVGVFTYEYRLVEKLFSRICRLNEKFHLFGGSKISALR